MAERQGLAPWTPWRCGCFQDSFLDWPDPLRFHSQGQNEVNWLPDVDSHHDEPLNRRPCYFDIIGE